MEDKHTEKKDDAEDKKLAKKKERTSLIAVLTIIAIIVVLMIASYFIITSTRNVKTNTANRITYNNYDFAKLEDNHWYVQLSINNVAYNMPFYYNPYEVENVSIDNTTFQDIKRFINYHPGGNIYFTMDPDESSKIVIAAVELGRILGNRYNIFNMNVISSFTKDSVNGNITTYPIITCANATPGTMVMWFAVADENKVMGDSNCIVIKARSANESIMVADALSYRILTIIRK